MLKWTMVRYKVKADRAAENESYITAVFEQLKREAPSGISYASFKLADGVSFVHVAGYEEALAGAGADTAPASKSAPFVRQMGKIGRNDPCPCGSGKKYKHCHGKLS